LRQTLNVKRSPRKDEYSEKFPKPLTVVVNDGRRDNITGLSYRSKTYLPFDFIKRYFDVYGSSDVENSSVFHFKQAYGERLPIEKYNSTGVYMTFNHVYVERRPRVKYVTGTDNVPLSNQWNKAGYIYPTQVAQYCLAHYSRWLTETEPVELLIQSGSHLWVLSNDEQMSVRNVYSKEMGSHVLEFKTLNDEQHEGEEQEHYGVWMKLDRHVKFPFFVFRVKFFAPSYVLFRIQLNTGNEYVLVYSWSNDHYIRAIGQSIHYGIGKCEEWITVARNVVLDVYKGMNSDQKPTILGDVRELRIVRLISVSLVGHGQLGSLKLLDRSHHYQMMAGADWLANNQDSNGGWPVAVKREIAPGMSLSPGWYSSMAQGQAISCLCRIYKHTGDKKYLRAALKATEPFDVLSKDGGVRAIFAETVPWYEEYPTKIPSFVLNGFIYSLLGLYDLTQVAPPPANANALRLYNEGLKSLTKLLLLYDLGFRTSYDLRHFTLHTEPRVARWDYHVVHVGQLLTLGTIDHSTTLWNRTASRWEKYMIGYRAKHN
jgi:heparosan-N-sulfate-glucuronate 5-epimerase